MGGVDDDLAVFGLFSVADAPEKRSSFELDELGDVDVEHEGVALRVSTFLGFDGDLFALFAGAVGDVKGREELA